MSKPSTKYEELIHEILYHNGEKLAVAESCTGGVIASRFTALAGASLYFEAGIVSYSNSSKINILEVAPLNIEQYGAVSEQVARQMAEGVRRVTSSHYGLSTTGIAGPSGGSEAKPVGTVWIGVATPQGSYAVVKHCGAERAEIVDKASSLALEELYHNLKK